jgi:hypothetical protein
MPQRQRLVPQEMREVSLIFERHAVRLSELMCFARRASDRTWTISGRRLDVAWTQKKEGDACLLALATDLMETVFRKGFGNLFPCDFPLREAYAESPAVAAKSGQQLLPAMCASCLPLALYGSAALVKVVPPPPAASTLTMLAPPGTAALRKHEANL